MPADHTLDVSILLVSYNTLELTSAALDSIQAQTQDVKAEVIVVDNASTDGSGHKLKDHPVITRFIALDENIGFARANNLAAEYAKGRYVLLLNPDTVVLNQAIDRLVSFADANKQALIWGGRTVFSDGRLNPKSCWQKMTPWSLFCRVSGLSTVFPASVFFNSEAIGRWQRDQMRQVDIISGCFFLMPTTVWTALGGFDPIYFMYGEEVDLCLRARRIGAKPLMTPDAEIVHYGGASEATRTDKMIKLLAAQATLIERHWPYPLNEAGQKLLMCWPLSRWIGLSCAGRLCRRPDWESRAKVWKEIWDARLGWQFGYARQALTACELKAQTPISRTSTSHAKPTVGVT